MAKQIGSSITKVVNLYARGGFVINIVLMDQEFDKIVDEVSKLEINTAAARENVGEIERAICTMKERSRAVVSYQPYAVLPKPIVIHLVYFSVLWLNNKPNKLGISQVHSPREIITRRKLDWEKHCQAGFGDFVQASYDRDVKNGVSDMRTYNGIYLGPTGNHQGNVKVFNIGTGKVKKPRTIRILPVPDRVIILVNKLGKRFQRESQRNKLEFLNRHKDKYAWDNAGLEDDDMALVEDEIPHPGIAAEITGVDLASETPGVSPSDTYDDSAIDILDPSQEQLVEAGVQNNSLSIAGPDKNPGVPLVNIPNDDTMIDLTNSSQECKVTPKREPKSQFKNEDDE